MTHDRQHWEVIGIEQWLALGLIHNVWHFTKEVHYLPLYQWQNNILLAAAIYFTSIIGQQAPMDVAGIQDIIPGTFTIIMKTMGSVHTLLLAWNWAIFSLLAWYKVHLLDGSTLQGSECIPCTNASMFLHWKKLASISCCYNNYFILINLQQLI